MSDLETYNLNIKKGLELCADDPAIYNEVKKAFYDDWSKKLLDIDNAFEAGDLEKYRNLMHSIKSASLYIGGQEISDLAKSQECAVKENNLDFLRDHHKEFMRKLESFLKRINGFKVEKNEKNS